MGTHTKSIGADGQTDPVTQTLDSIRRIVRMLRVGSRAAEKQVGLSGAQLFVLHALAKKTGLSLNELAEQTRTHQSSVSVVVQRLVDRRLITRNRSEADSRRLELSLTPLGVEVLHDAPDVAQHRLIDALDRMLPADQTKLALLLSQLVTELGESDESPQMFFEEEIIPPRIAKKPKANRNA